MDIKDIKEKLKDKLTYGKTKLEAGQYAKPGAGCDGENTSHPDYNQAYH